MADKVTHQQTSVPARYLLLLVAAGSALLGASVAVAMLVRIATTPGRSLVTVRDMYLANAQVPEFTRELPGLEASYSSVDVTITDPPRSLLWLDVAQQAATSAGFVVVCAVLVWLCLTTLKGRPFASTAPWVLVIAGLAVITFNVAADILTGQVQNGVLDFVGSGATGGDAGAGPYEGFGAATEVLFSDLGWAATLCVLGVVFALGNRLQRDTERLV